MRASDSSKAEVRMARWYEVFLDVCKAAKRRHLGIIAHPNHKMALMDMIERVVEDPLWNMGEPPPIVFYTKAPKDSFQFIDIATMKTLTFMEGMRSGTGLGRFNTIYTPDASIKMDD